MLKNHCYFKGKAPALRRAGALPGISVKIAAVEIVDVRLKLTTDIHVVCLNSAADVQSELFKIARPVKSILRLESGQVFDLMTQILEDAFTLHFITPYTQIGFVTVFRRPVSIPDLLSQTEWRLFFIEASLSCQTDNNKMAC
jgi:hypothetical protein